MKTKKLLIALGIVSLLAMFSTSSWAAPRFSVVGATTLYKPSQTGVTFAGKLNFGGGALIEFGMGPKFGLELGALYLQNKTAQTTTVTNTFQFTSIAIPLAFRVWLHPMISVLAGGYYTMGMGDIKITTSAGTTTTQNYADTGIKKSDFGAMGGLGFNLRLSPMMGLILEGRYLLGLTNISTDTTVKLTTSNILGLVGLRFGGGK